MVKLSQYKEKQKKVFGGIGEDFFGNPIIPFFWGKPQGAIGASEKK